MSLVDVIGQAFIKSGEKSAKKREAKEKAREEATAKAEANIKAVRDWEHALTYVIAAKANGTVAPEWAVAYIKHDTTTATAILHESQKQALLSHVNTDPKSNEYNKSLADTNIQDRSRTSESDVETRIGTLADIFRAKTDDVRYRETLIKTVVSYSMHKAKALTH